MKIKILFAIGRLSAGGAEKLLVRQLPAVNRDKFEPYLLTLFPEQKDSFQKEVRLDDNHWRKLNFKSLFDLPEWISLLKFLKKERFGVVVTSLFSANFFVRIAAILTGVPVIISYEHNLYPNKREWQIWADWFLAKWTDKIIVDSEAVRKFTAEQEKIPIEKFLLMYIPPLLDLKIKKDPALVRQELGISADASIVLTVSRLVEEKGHRFLVEAAKKVLDKFPNTYFVIVGWGHLEDSLKLQVKSQKLEDRILLPGRIDIQEVLPIADIYVEPALNVDIGIAVMEALRAKKPIIATAVGDLPVFVKDNKNGFLVEPGNALALAERISFLLTNDKLRQAFGNESEKVASVYSLKSYMDSFEELIKNLYKDKKPRCC